MKTFIIVLVTFFMVNISTAMQEIEFIGDATKYKNVDEILEGIPFKTVGLEAYEEIIKKGKVVVFLYDNFRPNGVNGWVAKLFKATVNDFPDISFLSIKYDKNIEYSKYNKLGFKTVPHYIFYVEGKNIFSEEGGPANEEEYLEFIDVMKWNLKELNNYE
ncbi:MAG: hypothetical protein A2Y97_03295 [Nitrospirae bacterium RBG_13_39_12]|nr:MAG: hypothetical protein A2Y97_03295 [Nitrospirae bacterium RBG_13_39_12]